MEYGPHINYIVRRAFEDEDGDMRPGYAPPSERVARWPMSNLRALVNSGYLVVDGSRSDRAPSPDPAPMTREERQPKLIKCHLCDWSGTRIKTHMTRIHHKEIE